jgi:RHS repeat-associated protein
MKITHGWDRFTLGTALLLALLQSSLVDTSPAAEVKAPPAEAPVARSGVRRAASPPAVQVNRTIPASAARAPRGVTLSAQPTEEELFRAAVLPEPLVPVGRKPTVEENSALARALEQYLKRTNPEDVSDLDRFLQNHPDSPWRVAVLANLGLVHYQACRFTQTFPAWEEAWRLGKDATEPRAKALVDRAVGELAAMNAKLGRMDRLDTLFAEMGDRQFTGRGTELVKGARAGLHRMKTEPWVSFRCGPLALDRIQASQDPAHALAQEVFQSRSTTNGFSLTQVRDLSQKLGLNMRMARRGPGAALILPAVVNWKAGHYAALISESGNRIHVQDATFGPDLWISRETLEQEASGYFLVAAKDLPAGWSEIGDGDGNGVFGKGDNNIPEPGKPQCEGGACSCHGMAVYSFEPNAVSLMLSDTPVGYAPPRGPAVRFRLSYLHREGSQPANFAYANFGPKWSFDWISFVNDNPSNPNADVSIYLRGGGADFYTSFNPTTSTFATQIEKRRVLTRTSANSYTLKFPDGSQQVFGWAVGAAPARRVFLTQMIDPQGNSVDLLYDGSSRLVGIRDSLGQVSTLAYEFGPDMYKVTKITDPFGRFASFQYDASGRLTNIVDVIGINSSFSYQLNSDFIEALTTPYGTSRFRAGLDGSFPWLEMTDPQGATERVEYRNEARGMPYSDPTGVPKSMNSWNEWIWSRNTFYWDKKAYREAAGDYSRARLYHWLHGVNPGLASAVLESEKQPLENRVWYTYPGQTWAGGVNAGMLAKPAKVGRILDDGSTQLTQYDYNDLGNVTRRVDPMGRTTILTYATNLVDLLETRQTAGVNEVLETRTYNAQHLPLTVADGSGHTNRYTYNAAGQLLAAINARNEATSYNYDTNGYLLSIDGPLPGASDLTSITYDGYGRLQTVTDPEGYTRTYDYDALDRPTRTTYPDGTYEENTYLNLNRVASRDRNGRGTQYSYDANQHLTSVEDPLHRITRYDWCSCGQMESLIDPMGRVTQWHRDIQGRVIAKEHADGSQVRYTYEGATSRLKTITDEKGQLKLYEYLPDDNVWRMSYLNAENPTPTVTFTYDGPYNRVKTMTDGIGLTTYGYYPANTNGGRLAFVDGPLPDDTVTYDYDELGRVRSRAIGGVAQRYDYDPLGRVIAETNVLGTFATSYVGASFRPAATLYPNGQRTDFTYYDNAGDQRLQEIHHLLPGNQTLARFQYAYDPAGQITNWLQQSGSGVPENWAISYDDAQQLLSVVSTTNGVVNQTYGYAYDPAGNRLFEDANGVRHNFRYNALNEIQSTDDPAIPARTYLWDADNRLVGVVQETNRFQLSYDGLGRCVRIQHEAGDAPADSICLLWCGDSICERRDSTGATTLKRVFLNGHQTPTGTTYYYRDHLGSVRALADARGLDHLNLSYSPYGVPLTLSANPDLEFGFAGYDLSVPSLLQTRHRFYDPGTARWLNRDPIREKGGINLFEYASDNPIMNVDPDGTYALAICTAVLTGVAVYLVWDVLNDVEKGRLSMCQGLKNQEKTFCAKFPDLCTPEGRIPKSQYDRCKSKPAKGCMESDRMPEPDRYPCDWEYPKEPVPVLDPLSSTGMK